MAWLKPDYRYSANCEIDVYCGMRPHRHMSVPKKTVYETGLKRSQALFAATVLTQQFRHIFIAGPHSQAQKCLVEDVLGIDLGSMGQQ
jgi:hypothetical protein